MRVLVFLALLSLLRSPWVEGASNFHLRNHTGLLFRYDFTEGQTSTSNPSKVRDATKRFLLGNLSTSPTAVSWSETQQGMSIPSPSGGVRAESELTTENLLGHLTSEFTLEFFFTSPINLRSLNLLIAGFGDWPPGTPYGACEAGVSETYGGWRLSSFISTAIDFEAVLSVNGVPTCVARSISITANTVRHLVVRAHDGTLSIVSHGNTVSAVGANLAFSPALWVRHPAPLTVANPHATTGWTGTMHMIAMYDRYISDSEISSNLNYGPPNSLPTTTNAIVALEDATTTLYP